ncbi:MAG: glycosyltransferase family 2 protein [Opitutaceae bacterium]|jgi:GT2 family glycosyltransferase
MDNARLQPPDVSVVIVSWNARDFLVECLQSLSAGVCRYSMEIIVVDNASTDGSVEAVQRQFPYVRLIRNETNTGFAKANNIGIAASHGRYLALVNSDVKVLKDCLTLLVDYLEQHPRTGMAGPFVFGRDGKLQRSCRGFPTVWNMLCRALALDSLFPKIRAFSGYTLSYWPQNSLRPVDILSGCFWLIRKEALAEVGGLDEAFFMYGEDMDWCKRFWAKGWPLVFVPAAQAIHYGGGSSSNAPVRFYIERQRADLSYWKKHHSRPAVACYFLISCLHLALRAAGYAAVLCCATRAREGYRHKFQRSVACLRWMLTFPSCRKT